jgi:hypothetical protein
VSEKGEKERPGAIGQAIGPGLGNRHQVVQMRAAATEPVGNANEQGGALLSAAAPAQGLVDLAAELPFEVLRGLAFGAAQLADPGEALAPIRKPGRDLGRENGSSRPARLHPGFLCCVGCHI